MLACCVSDASKHANTSSIDRWFLLLAIMPCLTVECCVLSSRLAQLLAGFMLLASTPCLTDECCCLSSKLVQLTAGFCC